MAQYIYFTCIGMPVCGSGQRWAMEGMVKLLSNIFLVFTITNLMPIIIARGNRIQQRWGMGLCGRKCVVP